MDEITARRVASERLAINDLAGRIDRMMSNQPVNVCYSVLLMMVHGAVVGEPNKTAQKMLMDALLTTVAEINTVLTTLKDEHEEGN